MNELDGFEVLLGWLQRLPALRWPADRAAIPRARDADGGWWVEIRIDIRDALAWRVVQELAHVLNALALDERLPTSFRPVSPPPYLNGGPAEFLSWVIAGQLRDFSPTDCANWLAARLPSPVEDRAQWELADEDEAD